MLSNTFSLLQKKIDEKGEISPFLFLYSNPELFHSQLISECHALLWDYQIDAQSLFVLSDDGKNIKIEELKKFLTPADTRPRFQFQIFVIENISRMTTQAQNACLKFFEEPGVGNLIFLTNPSEAWILETIVSRVQIHDVRHNTQSEKNDFFYSLISSHVSGKSQEMIRYFFSEKYEKEEYIDFLKTLVSYIAKTGNYTQLLSQLEEDINGIIKNNLQARYIVDKYIMELWV